MHSLPRYQHPPLERCIFYNPRTCARYIIITQSPEFTLQSLLHILCCSWFMSDSATSWTAACQVSLSFNTSQSFLKLVSSESLMPSNHLILCHPLLLLPSIFPSITVFSSESALWIRWPKYWSFSFSISPSNEHSGSISFRIDWFLSPYSPRDSQESSPTPQFKSINSSVLSLLYGPVLTSIHDYQNHSFDYMDLCWQSSISAFYRLSRLVIVFLPRSKCLLISGLQSPSAVVLEPKKIKSVTVSIVSPSICHEVTAQTPWSSFFDYWVLSQIFHSPLSHPMGMDKCTYPPLLHYTEYFHCPVLWLFSVSVTPCGNHWSLCCFPRLAFSRMSHRRDH